MNVLLLACFVTVVAGTCGSFGCCAGSHFPALGPGGMGCAQFSQCTGCDRMVAHVAGQPYENWDVQTFQNVPPCCEEIKKFISKLKTEGFNSKLTPGTGCSGLTSCDKCNMLNFCAWDNRVKGGACKEIAKVPERQQINLSKTCKVKDNYVTVALRAPREFEGTPDKNGFTYIQSVDAAKKANMSAPIVASGAIDWPQSFEGHLPAPGCGMIDHSKYPSGIPGCHDQFAALQGQGQFGNMDHGLPTDPRYPVETHVPQFPLGAHPNVPDMVAYNGGDYNQQPMEHSPWVIPDFNGNGCLGGPCDPHFLKPIREGPTYYGQFLDRQ